MPPYYYSTYKLVIVGRIEEEEEVDTTAFPICIPLFWTLSSYMMARRTMLSLSSLPFFTCGEAVRS